MWSDFLHVGNLLKTSYCQLFSTYLEFLTMSTVGFHFQKMKGPTVIVVKIIKT